MSAESDEQEMECEFTQDCLEVELCRNIAVSSISTHTQASQLTSSQSTGPIVASVEKGILPFQLLNNVFIMLSPHITVCPQCPNLPNESLELVFPRPHQMPLCVPAGSLVCLSLWILCSSWLLPNTRRPTVFKLHGL